MEVIEDEENMSKLSLILYKDWRSYESNPSSM